VKDEGAVCEKSIVRNMMKRVLSLRSRDLIWRNVQRRGCLLCETVLEAAGAREGPKCVGERSSYRVAHPRTLLIRAANSLWRLLVAPNTLGARRGGSSQTSHADMEAEGKKHRGQTTHN